MQTYNKVIFICEDNTCRSPMAESIFYGMLPEPNGIEVLSRGRVVLFPEPFNIHAEKILSMHGLKMKEGSSIPFSMDETGEHTLVLTMTMQQKIKMSEEYGMTENLFSLKEFAGEEGDVADPYGGGEQEYENCFVELSRLVKKLVVKLRNQPEPDKEEA